MVLVAALCSVDIYYQVLLSGAAERALDLEVQTIPPIRVTKYLSVNATRSKISYIILVLYLGLLATAEGLGILAAGGVNLTFPWQAGPWIWFGLIGAVSIIISIAKIRAARQHGRPLDRQLVVTGILLPAITVIIEIFLLAQIAADPSGVGYWIVAGGMLLALYMQYYWVYSAWQSGLYRHKAARVWPEGNDKVGV
jgi:hypothetical protein